MLNLTFLGTSAGVPTKHRNVTALAVECINPFTSASKQNSKSNRPWVLIDCGEGTQHQLLSTNISSNQLVVICITHVHGDHCYGLPGLLASMAMSGRKKPITILAPQAIEQLLNAVADTTDLYLPFAINFISIESWLSEDQQSTQQPITIPLSKTHRIAINVTKLSHRVASYAFDLTQTVETIKLNTNKLKAEGIAASSNWGKLQVGEDVTLGDGTILHSKDYTHRKTQRLKIVVAGDNDKPDLLTETVQDANLVVHEATYTQAVSDRIMTRSDAVNPMHTTAEAIGRFAALVNLPNLILTHFSVRYQSFDNPKSNTPNMANIRLEVEQFYTGNLWLASDFSQFRVHQTGVEQLSSNHS